MAKLACPQLTLCMFIVGTFQIEYELQSIPTGVCITCTFLDSSITGCVAVVHQRISQLGSGGLMNIESSHKFTRSNDTNTASGCITLADLEDYQIGVVGGRLIVILPTQTCMHILCRSGQF